MDSLTKEYLISFYDKQLLIHGDSPGALRWSAEGQQRQYRRVLEITDTLDGKKILDYGCGKGDFYCFLKECGIRPDYTGLDINPSLIRLAKQKYPGCTFRVFDIEEEDLREDFDYVFLCGVFNNSIEGVTDTFKNVLVRLFKHVTEGLALTALSPRLSERDFELNYTDPDEMLGFVRENITPHVALKYAPAHDDFTMFLYRGTTLKISNLGFQI